MLHLQSTAARRLFHAIKHLPLQLGNHGHIPRALLVQQDQFARTTIQSRQFSFAMLREREKVSVRHLAMAYQRKTRQYHCLRRRDCVRPEVMPRQRNDLFQHSKRSARTDRVTNYLCIRRNADEPELPDWAGSPGPTPDLVEPGMDQLAKVPRAGIEPAT